MHPLLNDLSHNQIWMNSLCLIECQNSFIIDKLLNKWAWSMNWARHTNQHSKSNGKTVQTIYLRWKIVLINFVHITFQPNSMKRHLVTLCWNSHFYRHSVLKIIKHTFCQSEWFVFPSIKNVIECLSAALESATASTFYRIDYGLNRTICVDFLWSMKTNICKTN